MFGTILLTIISIMHIYVFWRAFSVPIIKKHRISRILLIVLGILLWGIFLLGRLYGHGETGTLAVLLEFCGMNWMAIIFLAFTCILVVDILTGFGFLFRKKAPSLRGWALAVAGLMSAIALFQGLRAPVVKNYEVSISNLPAKMDGKVILALSDTHLGSLIGKDWLVARVKQVNEQQPDFVFLLGDVVEGHGINYEELVPIFSQLSASKGVWVVPGNHERYGRNNRSMQTMEEAGFEVLRDSWVEVDTGFILVGVEDFTSTRRSGKGSEQLLRALEGRPPGATILLSHTPWYADVAAGAGVGLMLSGHTHAGQVWPFNYLVKIRYPLIAGRYEIEGMTVIVCRGTGTWGPRMRLWHPGEILRVTLHGTK
ncbi:metallophosphoesterase [bacterium]|nr:metallophosphoesterase [bacterium]